MSGAGSIPPPPGGVPATAAAVPAPAQMPLGEAVLNQLPERLQELLRPIVLTGTVTAQMPDGVVRLRTQMGDILMTVLAPLPTDKPLTLQIAPGQPPGRAMLFSDAPVAAQQSTGTAQPPPSRPSVVLTLPSAPAIPPPMMPTGPLPPTLLPGSIIPALVLAAAPRPSGGAPGSQANPSQATQPPTSRPPASQAPADQAATSQRPAAQVPATSPPAGPSQGTPLPAGASQAGATPPPSIPAAAPAEASPAKASPAEAPTAATPQPAIAPRGGPVPSTPTRPGGDAVRPDEATPSLLPPDPRDGEASAPATSAKPSPLAQGATVALKIVSVTLPSADAPEAPDAPLPRGEETAAPQVRGTVAGATPQGQPIVATRQGMLVLTTQGTLPAGTRIVAELRDPAQALPAAPHEAEPAGAKDWPALRQVMTAIATADPELAHTLTHTILPQPSPKLSTALTFLMSALGSGDARSWLGDEAVATLERTGQTALLRLMDDEFRGAQRQAAEPAQGEWRLYTVPMFVEQTLHPVHIHVRGIEADERRDGGAGSDGRGSRFLIDLELSRFGPLQLDGLVRPRRFDLILRTHVPLPGELRAELTGVFADSVSTVGYAGALSFQTGARSWVKLTRAGQSGLGVTA